MRETELASLSSQGRHGDEDIDRLDQAVDLGVGLIQGPGFSGVARDLLKVLLGPWCDVEAG